VRAWYSKDLATLGISDERDQRRLLRAWRRKLSELRADHPQSLIDAFEVTRLEGERSVRIVLCRATWPYGPAIIDIFSQLATLAMTIRLER